MFNSMDGLETTLAWMDGLNSDHLHFVLEQNDTFYDPGKVLLHKVK